MTKREYMVAALSHRETDLIPFTEEFAGPDAQDMFMGKDWEQMPPGFEKTRLMFEKLDTFEAELWTPDGYKVTSHENEKGETIIQYETGAIQRTRRLPYFRHYENFPIQSPEDFKTIPTIDMSKPERYEPVKKQLEYFSQYEYFCTASMCGPLETTCRHFRGYDNFLLDIAMDKSFANELVEFAMSLLMEYLRGVLKLDIDGVKISDDLGSNLGLLFSPTIYRELIFPWHKKMAEETHAAGKFFLMHSHGNINEIFEDIIEAGVDCINPLDPADGMDLAALKETYGDRICFHGGISRYIGNMSVDELEKAVKDAIDKGAKKGGFILSSSGGIPVEMSKKSAQDYLAISKRLRRGC